jgi:hypothetical protein
MKKGLDQYRGSLSPAQIAAGMNAARENASRLLNDAKLLAQSERFASAAALAILSIELWIEYMVLPCDVRFLWFG